MKKKINLPNVINFLGAYWRKYVSRYWTRPVIGTDIVTIYTNEETKNKERIIEIHNLDIPFVDRVVMIREVLVQERSPGCLEVKNGEVKCKCDCPIPDKFYESAACEYGCYGPWPKQDK